MDVQVTVSNDMQRQVAQRGVVMCIMTNETFSRSSADQLKDLTYWNTSCVNQQGFVHLLSSTPSPYKLNAPYYTMSSNTTLPKTADGFVVLVLNNASQAGDVKVFVSVRGQLYANSMSCSDKQDGKLLPSFDTRSNKIRNDDRKGIDSVGDGNICKDTNKVYCDGSSNSGRQVDLCGVCGGGCFPPLCSLLQCASSSSSSLLARVRFVDEFAAAGGEVSRTFLPAHRCPSDYGSIVTCSDLGCSAALGTCQGRKETYRIDTLLLSVTTGQEFKFPAGSLLVDGTRDGRRWVLTLSSFLPVAGIFRSKVDGPVGGAVLSLLPAPAVLLSSSPAQLQLLGTLAELEDALKTLSVTCSAASNDILDRQRLLRMQLQLFLNGSTSNPDGTIGTLCKEGWEGDGCFTVQHSKEIVLSCQPQDHGARFVAPSVMLPGRKPILNRQGHGTHVLATAGGEAYDPVAFPSLPLSSPLSVHNSVASSAKLMIVDIAPSSSLYLSPPDSIDLLFTRPYNDGARIFLNPWTCADFRWWKEQETSFSYNYLIAQDASLHADPQICDRYTIDARDVDAFVSSHPDLLVIFAAGDSEGGGYSSVASPGTCKNCLTVGMSQMWEEEEVAGASFLLDQCRPEDCPQLFWEGATSSKDICVDSSSSPPSQLSSCCTDKYGGDDPDTVDYRAQLGFAVSQQATLTSYVSKIVNAPPTYIGSMYTDKSTLKMERVKPELVRFTSACLPHTLLHTPFSSCSLLPLLPFSISSLHPNHRIIDDRSYESFTCFQHSPRVSLLSFTSPAFPPSASSSSLPPFAACLPVSSYTCNKMAPGVNVLSAKSDGNPNSGGVGGCRCCMGSGGDEKSSIVALTGAAPAPAPPVPAPLPAPTSVFAVAPASFSLCLVLSLFSHSTSSSLTPTRIQYVFCTGCSCCSSCG
eukprot:767636-Hanusia_phi.AAC.7